MYSLCAKQVYLNTIPGDDDDDDDDKYISKWNETWIAHFIFCWLIDIRRINNKQESKWNECVCV